jgi:BirA family biotin operon repressor/biotin-[acetyl-CoA-carboxylase] ligase
MELPKSEAIATKLVYVSETGSTNSDLISAAITGGQANWPELSVYVTGYQNAGRGRAGRAWIAPAGSSLFVSVLVRRNDIALDTLAWLPLLGGLAMARAVTGRLQAAADQGSELAALNLAKVGVKWPNDVLVGERKVSGVLSELLPDLSGVVVGAGLNVTLTNEQLPVETATSLALLGDPAVAAGSVVDAQTLDDILSRYLTAFRDELSAFVAHQGNGSATGSGLQTRVSLACSSLGQEVRVIMPGDQELWGVAKSIDEQGRLVVETTGGKTVAVSAGDIVHLRHR